MSGPLEDTLKAIDDIAADKDHKDEIIERKHVEVDLVSKLTGENLGTIEVDIKDDWQDGENSRRVYVWAQIAMAPKMVKK